MAYTNQSKNSASYTNGTKNPLATTTTGAGTPIGLLLTLTQAGSSATETYTLASVHSATFTYQTKNNA